MFELKQLNRDSISAALEKATRYRLLNEPAEAESICLDVLAIDPANHDALVMLILALTEQFDERAGSAFQEACAASARLRDEYSRLYYRGIISERRAKADFRRNTMGSSSEVYDDLREAMEFYELAAAIRPPGIDDCALRWNSCVRMLKRNPSLQPAERVVVTEMLE